MRIAVGVLGIVACREWHDPLPFEECQPYPLECPNCLFEDDQASSGSLLRLWQCEDPDLGSLQAIRRRAENVPASDTHFYELSSGLRIASVRVHDQPVPVCGREIAEEWWGAILDCADLCEIDGALPEAEPDLGACAP